MGWSTASGSRQTDISKPAEEKEKPSEKQISALMTCYHFSFTLLETDGRIDRSARFKVIEGGWFQPACRLVWRRVSSICPISGPTQWAIIAKEQVLVTIRAGRQRITHASKKGAKSGKNKSDLWDRGVRIAPCRSPGRVTSLPFKECPWWRRPIAVSKHRAPTNHV